MSNRKPLIGLDCDGVLYRWSEAAIDTFAALRGINLPHFEPDHWNALEEAVRKDDWHWLWNSRKPRRHMFGTGRAYADGIRAAHVLERITRVVVVTHRPPDVMDVTMDWLARQGLRPHGLLHFAYGDKKWQHELECAAYIDDSAANARAIAAKGIPVFVPERNWNREVHEEPEDSLITPFKSWATPLGWIRENLLS